MKSVFRHPSIVISALIIILSSTLLTLPPRVAQAQTSLHASLSAGLPGSTLTLTGSGYTPGGYAGTILWDGTEVQTFDIPEGGTFSVPFRIPADATDGVHTITVCSLNPCATGEFAQTADVEVFVGVIALDLTVSLEWEPDPTAPALITPVPPYCPPAVAYLVDLCVGLRTTAAYLYAASEGQMTLGTVTIYTGGEQWDQADIRILANNAYRPTAFIGGIVDEPTPYIDTTTGLTRTIFYPAPILLGRQWNGIGAREGAWSQAAGWRTIGHELGHYALFLYDQYVDLDGNEQYCTSTGLDFERILPDLGGNADTLMAYHYTADKFWRGGAAAAPGSRGDLFACDNTALEFVYGEGVSEWQAIGQFYPEMTTGAPLLPPDFSIADFAGTDAADLFAVVVGSAAVPGTRTATVELDSLPSGAPNRLFGETYLLHDNPNNQLERIIGQGLVLPGRQETIDFLGVRSGDRGAVYVYDAATGARFATPPSSPLAATSTLGATASTWRPSIVIVPTVLETGDAAQVTALNVRLEDCARSTKAIEMAYCPAGGTCDPPVSVSAVDGVFTHAFQFPLEPPGIHGYIYARKVETGEESVVWYQLGGGGGSGRTGAHAPLVDGLINVDVPPGGPGPARDGRVLFSPTPACSASAALPDGVQGIIGAPFNIQPVIAGANASVGWGQNPADPPLRVRLNYNQDLLNRLEISENQLVILSLDAQGVWQALPTAAQSTRLDWIAAEPQVFDGDGAFYALAYRNPQLFLPVIRR